MGVGRAGRCTGAHGGWGGQNWRGDGGGEAGICGGGRGDAGKLGLVAAGLAGAGDPALSTLLSNQA